LANAQMDDVKNYTNSFDKYQYRKASTEKIISWLQILAMLKKKKVYYY